MTEDEWQAATDPTPMLEFLRGRASDRRLRLFAAACCRGVWHLLTEDGSREAIEFAERLSDHPADARNRDAVRATAYETAGRVAARYRERTGGRVPMPPDPLYAEVWMYLRAANAATLSVSESPFEAAATTSDRVATALAIEKLFPAAEFTRQDPVWVEARLVQVRLLGDIFGNPFRSVRLDPSWRTSTVLALARGVYADRAFDRLPILADALQDADCDHPDVLAHCCGDGPHARGCWVVDLLLGKE